VTITSDDVTFSMEPKEFGRVISVRGDYMQGEKRHRFYTEFNTPTTPAAMETAKATAKTAVTGKINANMGE